MTAKQLNRQLLSQGLKWCSKGKHAVKIREFSKDAGRSKDGLGGVCLECAKITSKTCMSRLHDKRRKAGRCVHCDYRKCRCDHSKNAAMAKLNQAVRVGKIIKPSTCPKCGHRVRICGHIFDITAPLNVEWLCCRCLFEKYPRKQKMEEVGK
jgi:hypothetical protein